MIKPSVYYVKRRNSMEEREFHLCRESWIYVMEQDYQVKEVTLIDALVKRV